MSTIVIRRLTLVVAVLLLGAACAGQSRTGSARRSQSLITTDEILEMRTAGVRDLYELVSRQRPAWLQRRGDRSFQLATTVLVYHNEMRLGGVEALRDYPLQNITSLRYLDSAQAGLLPGAGSVHVEGAIIITTGTGLKPKTEGGTPPPHR
jgi:hypothetical protein